MKAQNATAHGHRSWGPVMLKVLCLAALSLNLWAQAPSEATIPETVKQFLKWEFHSNNFNDPAKRKSPQSFKMQHIEFPLAEVQTDFAADFSPAIRDSLIFNKNGVKYVRWVINPEDSEYQQKVIKFLTKKKIPFEIGQFFNGFLTASRSMIAENPLTGAVFSVKVSTDNTGGAWQDKGVDFVQSNKARLASDLVGKANKHMGYKTMVPLLEPAGFTLAGIDQSMIIRDLGEMATGEKYYLPGFAAIHTKEGKRLAKLNGSNDPEKFWRQHFAVPLAKAMAEEAAFTGLTYESAHPQQYLVELDHKMRPTGRIVFRDFNDSHVLVPAFDPKNIPEHKKFLDNWLWHYKQNDLKVRFGIFKGSGNHPDWVSEAQMEEWVETYFDVFEKEFSRITNIPTEKMNKRGLVKYTGTASSYRTNNYLTGVGMFSSSHYKYWGEYFKAFPCFHGQKLSRDGKDCQEVLAEIRARMEGDLDKCSQDSPSSQDK